MKKLLLMLVVLVLVSAKGFSQTTTKTTSENESFGKKLMKKLEFGITAGGNYSNFTGANFATDPLPGFHAGLTVSYKFTDNFLVSEEFLYSLQGAKVKDGTLAGQEIKLSYASVPILFKYRTNSGFYVEAGPQASFKVKEDLGGITDSKFAKKIDFAMAGGLGYQSKMGLGIGARYVYGLQKVQETPSPILGDIKNNSIQASIFYVF
ncbi:porin family protein [Mucilaginibacter sp. OK098]|uniref:porin family protein n=1 Tax=Mucilaginibacter sp. OK098 TaxID=1855297 RepID=UPI00093236B2|nr:porin family protein [Mucilaginibacter sp. OK098]